MAADGSIQIDTQINKNNVNRELRDLQKEMRNMGNEMKLANTKALMPFRKQMLEVEKNFHTLAGSMGSYTGTNQEFMSQVQQLGAEYKTASENMLKANTMTRMSFIKTAGAMMNMSTQASKISANFERMNNPLYNVNRASLAVADSLNRVANNGNAAVLSLKMLGPNANMKQLNDMTMMINQGLMRMQMVAFAAAAASLLLFGALHKANMEMNPEYAAAFTNMITKLKKAFQPMVDAFAAVMIPIYNFIAGIAELMIKFNEAHPTLAKFIQGFLMLIPLLTLILSPLAIGIGLIAGMQAAFASFWAMIGPLVTGLAAISGTVWIVAGAIVALVAGIMYLWNTSEGFRNAIITGWNALKVAAQATWDFILNSILIPVWNAIVAFGMEIWGQFQSFWKENGDNIMAIAQVIWSFVKDYIITYVTVIVETLKVLWNIVSSVVSSVWGNIKGIISGAIDIILGIIGIFVSIFTGDWQGVWENAKKIFQGAWRIIANLGTAAIDLLLGLIRGLGKSIGGEFGKITESFYNAGKGFMDMLRKGIENAVSGVLSTIEGIAQKIRNFLPFSPAKVGPLSDLDKLDFAGPIKDSLKKGLPGVQASLSTMLSLPTISPAAPAMPIGGSYFGNAEHSSNATDLTSMVEAIISLANRPITLNGRVVSEEIHNDVQYLIDFNNNRKQQFAR